MMRKIKTLFRTAGGLCEMGAKPVGKLCKAASPLVGVNILYKNGLTITKKSDKI
jgi:hypothetical protein